MRRARSGGSSRREVHRQRGRGADRTARGGKEGEELCRGGPHPRLSAQREGHRAQGHPSGNPVELQGITRKFEKIVRRGAADFCRSLSFFSKRTSSCKNIGKYPQC